MKIFNALIYFLKELESLFINIILDNTKLHIVQTQWIFKL